MKTKLCKKCGEKKAINEDNWHRCATSKSGFTLSKCRLCMNTYHREKLTRILRKTHFEPPMTPFELSCLDDRIRREMEPVYSVFKDVL